MGKAVWVSILICALIVFSVKVLLEESIPLTPKETPNVLVLPINPKLCSNPVRVGNAKDGGWTLCNTWSNTIGNKMVLSFGIADDWSFDREMDEKWSFTVHGYDPSVAPPKGYNGGRRKFHSLGLGNVTRLFPVGTVPFFWPGMGYLTRKNAEPWNISRYEDMVKDVGSIPSIVKMDVEGAEWFALDSINVDQLVVELHFAPNDYHLSSSGPGKDVRIVRKRTEDLQLKVLSHLLKRMEAWNVLWNGDQCLEVSFIKRKGS